MHIMLLCITEAPTASIAWYFSSKNNHFKYIRNSFYLKIFEAIFLKGKLIFFSEDALLPVTILCFDDYKQNSTGTIALHAFRKVHANECLDRQDTSNVFSTATLLTLVSNFLIETTFRSVKELLYC